eukprot:s1331_g18.t1
MFESQDASVAARRGRSMAPQLRKGTCHRSGSTGLPAALLPLRRLVHAKYDSEDEESSHGQAQGAAAPPVGDDQVPSQVMLEQRLVSCEISIPQVLEASAEALCKATGVEELVKVFDRSMVVLEMGFAPWKATLRGAFCNVDKALKENFLGIMLEIWKHASTPTVLDEAVKSQIQIRFDLNLSTKESIQKKEDETKAEAGPIDPVAEGQLPDDEAKKPSEEQAEGEEEEEAEMEEAKKPSEEQAEREEEEEAEMEEAKKPSEEQAEGEEEEEAEMEEAKEQAEEQAEGEEEEVSAPYEEESPSQELPFRWVGGELVRRVDEPWTMNMAAHEEDAKSATKKDKNQKKKEAAETATAAARAARAEEDSKAREAAEAAARLRAEEERKAREAAEAAARAAEERKAREAAEAAARLRAEEERKAREAAEAAARAEEERKAREAAEAAARLRAVEERKAREDAEAATRAEEERKAREAAEVAAMAEEERQTRETAEAATRAEEERKAREAAEAARMAEEERTSREVTEAAARTEEQREVTVKVEEQRKAEHAAKKLPPKHKAAPPIFQQRPVPKRMPLQRRVPKHDYTGLGDVPQWLQDKENRAYEAYAKNPPPGHKPLEEAWRWRSRRTFELQSIQKEGDPESEPDLQDRLLALPARELLFDLRALADKEEAMLASVPEHLYFQLSMAYEAYRWAVGLGQLSTEMKETLRDQIWDTVLYVEDRFRDPRWTRQAARKLGVLVTVPATDLLEARPQAQTVRSLEAPAAAKPTPRKRPRSPTSPPAPRKRSYRISVPVDEVEFSQDSIGERFTCGRELQTTIDDLRHGKVHPDSSAFLVLQAMKTAARTRYICRNNRRLYCLKEFQKRERRRREDRDFIVKVRLNVIEDRDQNISDFIGHRTSGPAVEDSDSGDSPSPAASWP